MSGERFRLRTKYQQEVAPQMQKKFAYGNVNEIPKIDKIVLNMGLGDVKDNSKSLKLAVEELQAIAGQNRSLPKQERALQTSKYVKEWT